MEDSVKPMEKQRKKKIPNCEPYTLLWKIESFRRSK
jgi:hypothetical protein